MVDSRGFGGGELASRSGTAGGCEAFSMMIATVWTNPGSCTVLSLALEAPKEPNRHKPGKRELGRWRKEENEESEKEKGNDSGECRSGERCSTDSRQEPIKQCKGFVGLNGTCDS